MAITPFPDLKGQAPLRPVRESGLHPRHRRLFLTSKVRLHCDTKIQVPDVTAATLFLTSKVRLHCDWRTGMRISNGSMLFLTSKVRLHCDTYKAETNAAENGFS